jgi:hypothetical protein
MIVDFEKLFQVCKSRFIELIPAHHNEFEHHWKGILMEMEVDDIKHPFY